MELGGGTQGDESSGYPPEEVRTSVRISKRHLIVEQRRRWRSMREIMRKGTGTEIPQGGNR